MKILITIIILFLTSFQVLAQSTDSIINDVSNASLNQDDPSVSINRKYKELIIIGASSDYSDMDANGITAYTSTDSGKTWLPNRLPLPSDQLYNYGEPSLTSDNNGNFYYAYVTNDGVDSDGSIAIATSTDGKSWKNATAINNNPAPKYYGSPDGVFITVDNSSSSLHQGRVYAVWEQFYSADSLINNEGVYISWSDNQCKTWSTPKFLAYSDDYQMVRTGKNGEVYVVFSDSANFGHQIFVSNNGGQTFSNSSIGIFNYYPFFSSGNYSGLTGLKGSQGIIANPYPAIDVNSSTNRIYCVYGDFLANTATQYYSYSDDNGANWSLPQIIGINLLDSADRFDPSVSVDQQTGNAYVFYYSSESDPKNSLVAPYRLKLTDNLSDPEEMLAPDFNPVIVEKTSTEPPYIGDHTSSDAFAGMYVGSWTQNRAGLTDGDIFAFISIPAVKNSVENPILIHSQQAWLSSPYPNPSNGENISLSYYVPHIEHINISLFDESGRMVLKIVDKTIGEGSYSNNFELGNIPTGSYFIRMVTDDGILSKKLIVGGK